MKIVLGLPVVNEPYLTQSCLTSVAETVTDRSRFSMVVVDNGSEYPFALTSWRGSGLNLGVLDNPTNRGYYFPLLQLYERYPDADLIGLCHNDVYLYEQSWDRRVRLAFES